MRYVVVTGGVMSGIGKGSTMAAVGKALQSAGTKVTALKIDPYLNMGAGMLSPYEHGEVYVLDDGAEVDLDFGTYERALGVRLTAAHSITGGKAHARLRGRMESGDYMGKTLQVTHVTGEVVDMIKEAAVLPVQAAEDEPEVCLVEVGGTVGDLESRDFLDAIRLLRKTEAVLHIHLVYLVNYRGELKTMPAQHSALAVRAAGLTPDIVVTRKEGAAATPLDVLGKVHRAFSSSLAFRVVDLPTLQHLEHLTPHLAAQCADILGAFTGRALPAPVFERFVGLPSFRVALVGKYADHHDAYHSVFQAVQHAAAAVDMKPVITAVDVEDFRTDLGTGCTPPYDAVVLPGGFGNRGAEATIDVTGRLIALAADIPTLAICMGMQCAVIAAARTAGTPAANSAEYDDGVSTCIIFPCNADKAMNLGKQRVVPTGSYTGRPAERFRNRYSLPSALACEALGVAFPLTPRSSLHVTAELDARVVAVRANTGFFVGTQYHPEFLSSPGDPSPDFVAWAMAAKANMQDCS